MRCFYYLCTTDTTTKLSRSPPLSPWLHLHRSQVAGRRTLRQSVAISRFIVKWLQMQWQKFERERILLAKCLRSCALRANELCDLPSIRESHKLLPHVAYTQRERTLNHWHFFLARRGSRFSFVSCWFAAQNSIQSFMLNLISCKRRRRSPKQTGNLSSSIFARSTRPLFPPSLSLSLSLPYAIDECVINWVMVRGGSLNGSWFIRAQREERNALC